MIPLFLANHIQTISSKKKYLWIWEFIHKIKWIKATLHKFSEKIRHVQGGMAGDYVQYSKKWKERISLCF